MKRADLIQEVIENSSRLKRLALADRSEPDSLCLSTAQLEFVHLLFYHEPASFKKVANLLGVSTSAVSQLADSLQADGYISRHSDPSDRRVIYMSLTQKGRLNLRRSLSTGFRAALETLSNEELATMGRIYNKMAEAAADSTPKRKVTDDKKVSP